MPPITEDTLVNGDGSLKMNTLTQQNMNRLVKFLRVTESCILWTGCKDPQGYGYVGLNGKTVKAQRLFYEMHRGPIPPRMVTDHLCRIPSCVNPEHLEVVTNKVNLLRGFSFSAIAARRTTCSQGHEYTLTSTYRTKLGHRKCRTCDRLRKQAAAIRRRQP